MTDKEKVLLVQPLASVAEWRGKYRIVRPREEKEYSQLGAVPITSLYKTQSEAWAAALRKYRQDHHPAVWP